MEMFTIREKIASEADAEKILQACYALPAPLGVPTIILDPANYEHQQSIWSFLRGGETVFDRVKKEITTLLHSYYGPDNPEVSSFFQGPSWVIHAITSRLEAAQKSSHQSINATPHPLFNAVICPRIKDPGAYLLKNGLHMPEDKIPDMPGYDAQWNALILWHEFAHARIGQCEKHADKVGAIIHQYMFADPTPLMAVADFRAVKAILSHEKPESLEKYGWGPVDTIDDVLAMDIPDAWPDAEAVALIPPPPDHSMQDVQFIGQSLRKISKLAFSEPDLLMLSMMSDSMLYRGNVENDNQRRIAERFAIAAKRLSIGAAAYTAPAAKLSL